MDALKQLYIKIMDVVVNMEHESPKSKKREDHKKELEGYTKVFCNFLDVEEPIREKMLSEIRRWAGEIFSWWINPYHLYFKMYGHLYL